MYPWRPECFVVRVAYNLLPKHIQRDHFSTYLFSFFMLYLHIFFGQIPTTESLLLKMQENICVCCSSLSLTQRFGLFEKSGFAGPRLTLCLTDGSFLSQLRPLLPPPTCRQLGKANAKCMYLAILTTCLLCVVFCLKRTVAVFIPFLFLSVHFSKIKNFLFRSFKVKFVLDIYGPIHNVQIV